MKKGKYPTLQVADIIHFQSPQCLSEVLANLGKVYTLSNTALPKSIVSMRSAHRKNNVFPEKMANCLLSKKKIAQDTLVDLSNSIKKRIKIDQQFLEL